jgi:hypothetical protein
VFDVGENEFLMLLLVVKPENDDLTQVSEIVPVVLGQQGAHPFVNVFSIVVNRAE